MIRLTCKKYIRIQIKLYIYIIIINSLYLIDTTIINLNTNNEIKHDSQVGKRKYFAPVTFINIYKELRCRSDADYIYYIND